MGWVVLGNVCMDGAHKPNEVSSYRTQVLDNGRPSFLLPCKNQLYVIHGSHADSPSYLETSKRKGTFFKGSFEDGLGDNAFVCTKDDNRPGMLQAFLLGVYPQAWPTPQALMPRLLI